VSELSAWDMASWPPGENLMTVYTPLALLLPDCPRATGAIEQTTDWWR
jgi:hypothetical protein